MENNNIKTIKLKAQMVVSDQYKAHSPDIMAHAVKTEIGKLYEESEDEGAGGIRYEYKVYAQAYLPELEGDFPAPVINISENSEQTQSEVKSIMNETLKEQEVSEEVIKKTDQKLTARTIEILYTSQNEGKPPFSLWSFFIHYSVKFDRSVPFIEVRMRNTDPKTSRGTVTTVKDGGVN